MTQSSAFIRNFVPVDMKDATPKQKTGMQVSPHDHRSKLGKVLTKQTRSRHVPHVGAKQRAKLAAIGQ